MICRYVGDDNRVAGTRSEDKRWDVVCLDIGSEDGFELWKGNTVADDDISQGSNRRVWRTCTRVQCVGGTLTKDRTNYRGYHLK